MRKTGSKRDSQIGRMPIAKRLLTHQPHTSNSSPLEDFTLLWLKGNVNVSSWTNYNTWDWIHHPWFNWWFHEATDHGVLRQLLRCRPRCMHLRDITSWPVTSTQSTPSGLRHCNHLLNKLPQLLRITIAIGTSQLRRIYHRIHSLHESASRFWNLSRWLVMTMMGCHEKGDRCPR